MEKEFNPAEFTATQAKPLPIILLLDESGSMAGEKINSLNDAVKKMLATLKKEETQASEFLTSIIGFGGPAARLINAPIPASQIELGNLQATGRTPLGSALSLAKEIIENKDKTPSRAYRPLVILVSDGAPNDNWVRVFEDFIENGRTSKCDRMALGIGQEAYTGACRAMLESFVAGTGHEVYEAKQADEIFKFFKYVTMSVVSRSLSKNPNEIPKDMAVEAGLQAIEGRASVPETVHEATPESAPQAVAVPADDEEEGYW